MKLSRSKLIETLRKLNNGKTVYQARKIADVSVRRVYQVKEAFDKTGKIPDIGNKLGRPSRPFDEWEIIFIKETYEKYIRAILNKKEVPRLFDKPIYVNLPLINLPKQSVVEIGRDIGAPIQLSWSCYFGDVDNPCLDCDQCRWRKGAFEKARVLDPLYDPQDYSVI